MSQRSFGHNGISCLRTVRPEGAVFLTHPLNPSLYLGLRPFKEGLQFGKAENSEGVEKPIFKNFQF